MTGRRFPISVVLAALVLAGAVALLVTKPWQGSRTQPAAAPAPSHSATPRRELTATRAWPHAKQVFSTLAEPNSVASGLGAVWIGTHATRALYRLDPRTNHRAAIAVPVETYGPLAIGAHAVWVSGRTGDYKLDPRTDRVVGHIPGRGVLYGAGSVWTFTAGCRLLRIDPRSDKVVARIDTRIDPKAVGTGDGCAPMAIAFGAVWVNGDSTVSRIDTRTNALTRVIRLPGGAIGGIVGGGNLYVDPAANTAVRLPIRITPFREGDLPAIAAGAGSVWLRTGDHGVARVDPATGRLIAVYPGQGGGGLTYAYGSLWLADLPQGTTWRERIS